MQFDDHNDSAGNQPRVARWLAQFCILMCGAALVLMAVGISAEIVSRNVFHYSMQSVEELTGYMIVLVTFLAMAVAMYENALFRVQFVLDRLSPGLRLWAEVLFLLIFAGFLVVIDYQSIQLVIGSYEGGYVASTLLATPLYLPQLLIPIGVTFTLLIVLIKLWTLLRGNRNWVLDEHREQW